MYNTIKYDVIAQRSWSNVPGPIRKEFYWVRHSSEGEA
jgi:hypothetical protein